MALFIHPAVEGNLGLGAKNLYVARFDGARAAITQPQFEEAGVEIGDTLYLTDNAGTGLFLVAAGFALEAYATGSGGGATNLSYTASPTNGTVASSTGTDAIIPTANGTNAGLQGAADTGWGTFVAGSKATFDPATATLPQVANGVAALVTALRAHNLLAD